MGGSPAVGCRTELQEEIQDTENPEAGRHGSWEFQEGRLEVLPAEDRSLPNRAVPSVGEEPTHHLVPVVPVPDADSGSPLQGGRLVPAEEDVERDVSEWEFRERREREEERRAGAEELGAGEERRNRCFSRRPSSWRLRKRCRGRVSVFFVLSFVPPSSFPLRLLFLGAYVFYSLGTGLGGGQRGACKCARLARTANRKPGLKSVPP